MASPGRGTEAGFRGDAIATIDSARFEEKEEEDNWAMIDDFDYFFSVLDPVPTRNNSSARASQQYQFGLGVLRGCC